MSGQWLGLIELLLVFGVIFGWAGWQWWSWRQWRRQQAKQRAHEAPPPAGPGE